MIHRRYYSIRRGIFFLLVGLRGDYIMQWVHLPGSYSIVREYLVICFACIAASGGGTIILRIINGPKKQKW
jgi:hypothetical protein